MASTQIPLTFRASPLPTDFVGTVQDFADAFVARLSAESANDISFFASGTVAPTSNVGPWLKNDQTWYVWSDTLATYIPEVIEFQSLKYIAQQAAPDPSLYVFWIELDGSGRAISIKYFSGGTWNDIYADKFAQYFTSAETTAAIAAAGTTLSVNYPVMATSAGSQTINTDGTNYQVLLPTIVINPDAASNPYDAINSRYVAPVDGIYHVDMQMQIDNIDSDAPTIEFSSNVLRNGVSGPATIGVGVRVPIPSGGRWYPTLSGFIQLSAGDYITLVIQGNDSGSGHTFAATGTAWYVYLIRKL